MLVLVIPQSFYLQQFFHNFEFSEELAKSKSILLTSDFNTLIFKFNRFKISFQVVFKNFRRQMISAVAETWEASIEERNFFTVLKLRNSRKNGKIDQKRIF